jgi:hypothetical protein
LHKDVAVVIYPTFSWKHLGNQQNFTGRRGKGNVWTVVSEVFQSWEFIMPVISLKYTKLYFYLLFYMGANCEIS